MHNLKNWRLWSTLSLILVLLLAACATPPAAQPPTEAPAATEAPPATEAPAATEAPPAEDATTNESESLTVVATTGHIADTLLNLGGGELFSVESLLGPGIDPHTYVPTEGDIELFETADIVFYNGVRLEAQMDELLEQIGERGETLVVGVGNQLPEAQLLEWEPENDLPYDPHIWNDIRLWIQVTQVMADTLAEADPANADAYAAFSEDYQAQLEETHEYLQAVAESIPEANRTIISGHDAFNYFGRTYGFEVEAVQGVSTETEASAADIQQLVDLIVERDVPAIFAENIVAPDTIEAVQAGAQAEGVDVQIGGELYSDALGEPGSPGETYIGLMRYNIDTIAAALGGTPGIEPGSASANMSGEIVLYTTRGEALINGVLEAFSDEYPNIEVTVVRGSNSELGARILEEQANPQANVFINSDTLTMEDLYNQGVFLPNDSAAVMALPEQYRADDGSWAALTLRGRVIMYNTDLIEESEVPTSLTALADPEWAGRIGSADSTNGAMMGTIVALNRLLGEDATTEWVEGLVANNTLFSGSHTDIRQAVGAGEVELGLVNHYYYFLSLAEGAPVGIVWPDQGADEPGLIVNSTNIGILQGTEGETLELAQAFVDFMLSETGQTIYAQGNFEWPIVEGIPLAEGVPDPATFNIADIDLKSLVEGIPTAREQVQLTGMP